MTENQDSSGAWIEIARSGRFQDSGGVWHDFTNEQLAQMAAGYDPAKREAPLVLGHPATDAPAHGWIKALKFNGRKLLARVACISDEIRKAVDKSLYRYVSMSLYRDGGLRHVGLLGAVPPAINGLAPVSFNGEAAFTINFSQERRIMDIEELQRKIWELEARLETAVTVQEFKAGLKIVAQALREGKAETAGHPLDGHLKALETWEPSTAAWNFEFRRTSNQGEDYRPLSAKL